MYANKVYATANRLRVAKPYKKPKGGQKKNATLKNYVALTTTI